MGGQGGSEGLMSYLRSLRRAGTVRLSIHPCTIHPYFPTYPPTSPFIHSLIYPSIHHQSTRPLIHLSIYPPIIVIE